eukprot:TRINITY_DN9962_c0_g1_i1.p1 TRINITY_DN9962_c0_g1~~TRINITY_DN9962_c0_g1_i1.p1  ORF type:complete len:628 (+),score=163.25 TRINITY_DN9962_c0_g1_i1:88-1884(+)
MPAALCAVLIAGAAAGQSQHLPWARREAAQRVAAFPDYDDPIVGAPPLARPPPAGSCSVALITGAAIESYYQRATQRFPGIPEQCSGRGYSLIALDWTGFVRGVQFDRFGALWLGGAELLRTTTPEPSPKGIHWRIERDLTHLAALFESAAPIDAVLSIPNVIDSTYTGVLNVNVTVTFYPASADSPGRATPDGVFALHDPVADQARWPWDAMSLGSSDDAHHWDGVATFTMPAELRGATELALDLYASAHGCEEFWYTNVPDKWTNQTGACGGGAARLLSVAVDGHPAGVLPPFPVIYTGGVCPLLWRPVSGIQSFDIPPYRFDLSPFAGLLADGRSHTVTVSALGNNKQGVWYAGPVLLVTMPQGGQPRVTGGQPRARMSGASPTVRVSGTSPDSGLTFSTEWTVTWAVAATLQLSDGSQREVSINGSVAQSNVNAFNPDGSTKATGELSSSLQKQPAGRTSQRQYPYSVYSNYRKDAETMELNGTVSIAYLRSESFAGAGEVGWGDSLRSDATYNRSLTSHAVVNKQLSSSRETFSVASCGAADQPCPERTASGLAPCWKRGLTALGGSVTRDEHPADFACSLPRGVHFCGYELC